MHVLGARHRWLTLVGTDRVKNQSIGNLIVRGGGDPSLSVGDIAEWASSKSQGILSIEGDIIMMQAYLSPSVYHPALKRRIRMVLIDPPSRRLI